jgi:hypothetical protein
MCRGRGGDSRPLLLGEDPPESAEFAQLHSLTMFSHLQYSLINYIHDPPESAEFAGLLSERTVGCQPSRTMFTH